MESIPMNSFKLEIDDEYDKCCGEIFLTIKGHIIFHCTLCEEKFNDFPEYCDHIKQWHCYAYSYISDKDDDMYLPLVDENSRSAEIANSYEENGEISIEVVIERNEEGTMPYTATDLTDTIANETKEKPNIAKIVSRRKPTIRKSVTPTERKHKCKICGFAFTQIFNMRAHLRRHFDEKRYKCSECSKAFHTRPELDTHVRRHKGERPFICEECGQSFVTAGALTMHVKRHKDIRNHECQQCDKKFFDSYALKIHMVGHSAERPYECDSCNAAFSRKKALVVHKKIHENKREYQCKYCDSGFNQKPGLYSHMKIKHSNITDGT